MTLRYINWRLTLTRLLLVTFSFIHCLLKVIARGWRKCESFSASPIASRCKRLIETNIIRILFVFIYSMNTSTLTHDEQIVYWCSGSSTKYCLPVAVAVTSPLSACCEMCAENCDEGLSLRTNCCCCCCSWCFMVWLMLLLQRLSVL